MAIDGLYSQFNISLMELKIENAKSLALGRDKSMDDVRLTVIANFLFVAVPSY